LHWELQIVEDHLSLNQRELGCHINSCFWLTTISCFFLVWLSWYWLWGWSAYWIGFYITVFPSLFGVWCITPSIFGFIRRVSAIIVITKSHIWHLFRSTVMLVWSLNWPLLTCSATHGLIHCSSIAFTFWAGTLAVIWLGVILRSRWRWSCCSRFTCSRGDLKNFVLVRNLWLINIISVDV